MRRGFARWDGRDVAKLRVRKRTASGSARPIVGWLYRPGYLANNVRMTPLPLPHYGHIKYMALACCP